MIPNPIRKVLSSMRVHRVRALLMGGQACVFYGAAEFSRDTDFVILADAANLARLQKALAELQAEPIAVPPFEIKYLRRGHAIHFRCQSAPLVQGVAQNLNHSGFRPILRDGIYPIAKSRGEMTLLS